MSIYSHVVERLHEHRHPSRPCVVRSVGEEGCVRNAALDAFTGCEAMQIALGGGTRHALSCFRATRQGIWCRLRYSLELGRLMIRLSK